MADHSNIAAILSAIFRITRRSHRDHGGDQLTEFAFGLKGDTSFRREFLAAKTLDEAAAVAVRHGWVVTPADLGVLARRSRKATEGRSVGS